MITCFHHLRMLVTEVVGDKRKEPWMAQNVSFFLLVLLPVRIKAITIRDNEKKRSDKGA